MPRLVGPIAGSADKPPAHCPGRLLVALPRPRPVSKIDLRSVPGTSANRRARPHRLARAASRWSEASSPRGHHARRCPCDEDGVADRARTHPRSTDHPYNSGCAVAEQVSGGLTGTGSACLQTVRRLLRLAQILPSCPTAVWLPAVWSPGRGWGAWVDASGAEELS